MDFKDKLNQLWCTFEGKLFLTNLANQLNAGIVSEDSVRKFLVHLADPHTDSKTIWSVFKEYSTGISAFTKHSLHFSSSRTPTQLADYVLLRVASFSDILKSVEFTKDENSFFPDKGELLRNFKILKNLASSGEDIRDALLETRLIFQQDQDVESNIYLEALPKAIGTLGTLRAKISLKTIGLSQDRYGFPKFCTYISDASGESNKKFDKEFQKSNPADWFRDKLGQDHLSREYKKERVVLGFVAFKLSQVNAANYKRPTPFDDTSTARFKGVFGKFGGAVSSWGMTADLSAIGKDDQLDGAQEIVISNNPLVQGDCEVLVGFCGCPDIERGDIRVGNNSLEHLDDDFFEKCVGLERKNSILNALSKVVTQ